MNPFDGHGGLLRAFGVTKSNDSTSLVVSSGNTESMFSRVSQASATHNPWMCGVPPPSIASTKALVSVSMPPTPIAAIDIITATPNVLSTSSSYSVFANKSASSETAAATTAQSGGFLSKFCRGNLGPSSHADKATHDSSASATAAASQAKHEATASVLPNAAAPLVRSRHFAPISAEAAMPLNRFESHMFASPSSLTHVDHRYHGENGYTYSNDSSNNDRTHHSSSNQTDTHTVDGSSTTTALAMGAVPTTMSAALPHHRSGCHGILNVPFPVAGDTWGAFHSVSLPRARPVAPCAVDMSLHPSAIEDGVKMRINEESIYNSSVFAKNSGHTHCEQNLTAAAQSVHPTLSSASNAAAAAAASSTTVLSHAKSGSSSSLWIGGHSMASNLRSVSPPKMRCSIGNFTPIDGVAPAPTLQAYSMRKDRSAHTEEARAEVTQDMPVAPRPISISPLRREVGAPITANASSIINKSINNTATVPANHNDTVTRAYHRNNEFNQATSLLPYSNNNHNAPEESHAHATPYQGSPMYAQSVPIPREDAVLQTSATVTQPPAPAPLCVKPLVAPQPLMPIVARARHAVVGDTGNNEREVLSVHAGVDMLSRTTEGNLARAAAADQPTPHSQLAPDTHPLHLSLFHGQQQQQQQQLQRQTDMLSVPHTDTIAPAIHAMTKEDTMSHLTRTRELHSHSLTDESDGLVHVTARAPAPSLVDRVSAAFSHDAPTKLTESHEPLSQQHQQQPQHHQYFNPMASTAKDFLSNLFNREDKTATNPLYLTAAQASTGATRKPTTPSDYSVFLSSPLFDTVEDEGDVNLDNLRGVLNTVFQGIKLEDVLPSVNLGATIHTDGTGTSRAGRYTEFTTTFVDNTSRRFRGSSGPGSMDHMYQTF